MSDIINALKRLERAGSEDSRQTKKLVRSAETIGDYIATFCPAEATGWDGEEGVDLPRGYCVSPTTGHLCCGNWPQVGADRVRALAFADDIASGWLDELSAWLEERARESSVSNLVEGTRYAP